METANKYSRENSLNQLITFPHFHATFRIVRVLQFYSHHTPLLSIDEKYFLEFISENSSSYITILRKQAEGRTSEGHRYSNKIFLTVNLTEILSS